MHCSRSEVHLKVEYLGINCSIAAVHTVTGTLEAAETNSKLDDQS